MTRRYDKGERRLKHVGLTAAAEIVFEAGNPRRPIGKCPNTVGPAKRQELLEAAIPGPNGDRILDVAKSLYAVHDGAIYEAQTSDGWHHLSCLPLPWSVERPFDQGFTIDGHGKRTAR